MILFYILVAIFFALPAKAQLISVEKAGLPMLNNIVNNPGAESALAGWTASGGTFTLDTSTFAFGKASLSWDSSASAQTLRSKQITIPDGLKGKSIIFGCHIIVPSGTATHQIGLYDGTTETSLTTIQSSSSWTRAVVRATAPSSGTIGVMLKSVAADEPTIKVDDCFIIDFNLVLYKSENAGFGFLKYPGTSNCNWILDSAAYDYFPQDTDCTGAIYSGIATELTGGSSQKPGFKVVSLPPGRYMVTVQARFGTASSSGTLCHYQITDGTNNSGYVGNYAQGSTDLNASGQLIGFFTYTQPQSNIEFQVQASESLSTAGNCRIVNSQTQDRLEFSIQYIAQ